MKTKPLHVLKIPSWYVTKDQYILGVFFQEKARMLASLGVQIGVIAPEVRPLKSFSFPLVLQNYFQTSLELEDGIPIYRRHCWNLFPAMEKKQMNFWVSSAEQLAEKYIKKYGMPDLLHAHSAIWGGIAAKHLAKKYSLPYLITEHRDNFLNESLFPNKNTDWLTLEIKDAFDQAGCLVAVSTILQRALEKYISNPALNQVVIPNAVDTSFFSAPLQAKPRINFRYLAIALLVSVKNFEVLIRAFRKVVEQDPSVVLDIGGEGPERPHLRALADSLGIGHKVRFLGELSRSEVREAMQRSHTLVVSSLRETFGIVLIEAMSTGIPVISTCCGGPEDIVSEKVGKLIENGNEAKLTEAMLHVKDHYQDYDLQTIRQIAIDKYDSKSIAQQYINVYSQILK